MRYNRPRRNKFRSNDRGFRRNGSQDLGTGGINSTSKNFQKLKEKDLIIICDVGAYGMSLSSNYNVRPNPVEILIKESKINIVKKRQKLIDLI